VFRKEHPSLRWNDARVVHCASDSISEDKSETESEESRIVGYIT
jgi:hypothetical protein